MPYGFVYALSCSCAPSAVRYVGLTTQSSPEKRLRNHLKESRQGYDSHKCRWIMRHLSQDHVILVKELERAPVDQLNMIEKRWIAQADDLGWDLTNSSLRDWLPLSLEARAKQAASLRKTTQDPVVRARLSAAHKGQVITDDHRAQISASLTGRVKTDDHLAAISAALRGKPNRGSHTRFHTRTGRRSDTCQFCLADDKRPTP